MSETPSSPAPPPASEPLTTEDLQALLADAEARAQQHREQHLRAVAELENVRKRAQRDVEQAHRFGVEKLAQELLPVKDSLDLAVENAGRADTAALVEGQAATLRLLHKALERIGITEIDPTGQPFACCARRASSSPGRPVDLSTGDPTYTAIGAPTGHDRTERSGTSWAKSSASTSARPTPASRSWKAASRA